MDKTEIVKFTSTRHDIFMAKISQKFRSIATDNKSEIDKNNI